MDSLTLQVLVGILVGIAYAVGLTGIVVPVIPGSITILIASLVWAIVLGGWAWLGFGLIALFCAAGMTCSYVMTGRKLRQAEVPYWPIVIGIVAAIIGFFAIPVIGLPIGFVAGLFGAEWYRRKDPKLAWDSSWVAIKALGIGICLELLCGFLSLLTFGIFTALHFFAL